MVSSKPGARSVVVVVVNEPMKYKEKEKCRHHRQMEICSRSPPLPSPTAEYVTFSASPCLPD